MKKKISKASTSTSASEEVPEIDEELANTIKLWLKYNDNPTDEVVCKWRQTSSLRRSQLLKSTITLQEIFKEWQLYKHTTLGPKLVSSNRLHIFLKYFRFFIF